MIIEKRGMLEGQRMSFHTFLSFLLFSFHGYLAQDHWRPTNALMFFGPSINQSLNLRVDREHKRSEDQSADLYKSPWKRTIFIS